MRKYDEQREEARGLTVGLCLLLGYSVVGTICLSAVAMAGLATAAAYGYVSATTTIKMPNAYWWGIFYQRLMQCGVLTTLAVVGTAVYKSWQLAEGGGRGVARMLGGTRLIDKCDDAGHKRLVNVVEELAIATGIKPPPIFVLEKEEGINAFAAGLNEKDAVIGVTRGALDRLNRGQLQGVVAHEFSHIKNGDMRLGMQLLGVVTGIQAIALAAQFLLRLSAPEGRKHPLAMVLALVFGAALWPIGQIGSLFAKLIQLAVNRQREFLADASAVQFTRDPVSLCEALSILLDDMTGARLAGTEARLASYMFFADSSGTFQRLLQSHPPLQERIRRLEPGLVSAGV